MFAAVSLRLHSLKPFSVRAQGLLPLLPSSLGFTIFDKVWREVRNIYRFQALRGGSINTIPRRSPQRAATALPRIHSEFGFERFCSSTQNLYEISLSEYDLEYLLALPFTLPRPPCEHLSRQFPTSERNCLTLHYLSGLRSRSQHLYTQTSYRPLSFLWVTLMLCASKCLQPRALPK